MSDFFSYMSPLLYPTRLQLDYDHDNCLYIYIDEILCNNMGKTVSKRSGVVRKTDKELAASILPISTLIALGVYDAMKIVYPSENLETIFFSAEGQFKTELVDKIGSHMAMEVMASLRAVVKSDTSKSFLKMGEEIAKSTESFKQFYMQSVENDPPEDTNERIPLLEESCKALHEQVEYPCDCLHKEKGRRNSLDTVIIHLNDIENWSREDIADWLESLDIDLEVQVE